MVNRRLYETDTYVVLEAGQPDQFLPEAELLAKLAGVLANLPPEDIPPDLRTLPSPAAQSCRLVATSCELQRGGHTYLQWYAVRLEA